MPTPSALGAGDVDVMMPLLRDWDFDVLLTHNRFTLINRNAEAMIDFAISSAAWRCSTPRPMAAASSPRARRHSPRMPIATRPTDVLDPVRRSRRSARGTASRVGAAALQFSMRDPRITATVVGVTKPERVKQTLDWAQHPIPDAVWDELKAVPFSQEIRRPQGLGGVFTGRNRRQVVLDVVGTDCEVVGLLQIEPHVGARAEILGKTQRGVGRDAHLLLDQPFDAGAGHTKVTGKRACGQPERLEELLAKNFAGVDRRAEPSGPSVPR